MKQPAYRDSALPIEGRVADLLERMTLEEKVAQLRSTRMGAPQLTAEVLGNHEKMGALLQHGLGMLNPEFDVPMEETIAKRNAVQNFLLTQTRLGIPILFLDEAHHGLLAPEVDVFPHGLGLASTWDRELIERVFAFVAEQVRSRGGHMVLSPVVDVARDPRWGRTGETFGEDPYLCGVLGSAAVRGFQRGGIAATLKHLAAHGESDGGVNQGPANYSERVLREFHMEPFRLVIDEERPAAVMASYCDIDGIPSHANPWILRKVLREEWAFDGIVVSDWFGIDQLWNKHLVAADDKEAALRAFRAGVAVDLPHGANYTHLVELVREGAICEEHVNAAVRAVLTLKFKLGLFDESPINAEKARQRTDTAAGREIAREAASKSMVLLKNEGRLLPIRRDAYRTIAVIGPCAAVNYLGDYSGIPVHNVSLLEGLRAKVGRECKIVHAPGVCLTTNGSEISRDNYQHAPQAEFPSGHENLRLITEAVQLARQSDLIIAAVGENEQFSREAGDPERTGDVSTLKLLSNQEVLVRALVATKKPVVVYLMHGRPLSIAWIAQHVPAIVDGWFAGQEAGTSFADLLFGDINPSGKLTISYPRSVGHLPAYYNHKPSARHFPYVTSKNTPLFPFGHGLSYTTFAYSEPRVSDSTMRVDGAVTAEVDVTNTGERAGDEIVQLYIHQKVSSVTRPVKELKDFARISVAPNETRTVRFAIDGAKLAFWNAELKYTVEPGVVEIMVGPSSANVQTVNLTVCD